MTKFTSIIFFTISLLFLSSCKEEKIIWKDSYVISLGNHTFRIPTEYLLDARNRKDGHERYVVIMGKIPDLRPYENASSYTRPPSRENDGITFSLNYGDGKILRPDSLLIDWSMEGKNYTLPQKWEKEGLVHLGTYMIGGRLKENIYAYIRNGEPIAQLSCATYPDTPNPGCSVYQAYDDRMMSIHLYFDIEQLDWYAKEGMEKIEQKVSSWRYEHPLPKQ